MRDIKFEDLHPETQYWYKQMLWPMFLCVSGIFAGFFWQPLLVIAGIGIVWEFVVFILVIRRIREVTRGQK